jgi:hypothetical protein
VPYKPTGLGEPLTIKLKQPEKSTSHRKNSRYKSSANATKEFIAWDGEETRDEGYCLFGNSKGLYLRRPRLGTEEMLELIIETGRQHPNKFHVGFAFYYDVNQILKDIGKMRIAVLHKTGRVTWHGYTIEHIPHKIFTVSKFDDETGKRIRVRIDDCFTYFRSRFDKALRKYKVGTDSELAEITAGKDEREFFLWKNIDVIESYWRKELRLLVDLMNVIRGDVNAAGFFIGQWHGPGALASYALKEHGMQEYKKKTPEEILLAVLSAYSAGWFERFKVGIHTGPIYTADINSAYVHAISLLPNLAEGDWEHVIDPSPDKVFTTRFALYYIKLKGGFQDFLASAHGVPMPLPLRDKHGVINHPSNAEGWYWAPEAALVAGRDDVEITEAWVFHDDGSYPFAWVAKDYEHRLLLQQLGNPAEKVIKWMLASLYGRQAQRVGWNEQTLEPPPWHQLEWAGYITSYCRSMCYRAAMDVAVRGGLVSIDTDGVISTVPFREEFLQNGIGEGLGQWKLEEFAGMIYIQNGIYWFIGKDGQWVEPKLRGMPKEQVKDERKVLEALAGSGKIVLKKNSFIGYGQALNTDWKRWRTWETKEHVIDINYSGKRQHLGVTCRACKAGYNMLECLHDLAPVIPENVVSVSHDLPWMNPKKVEIWELTRHYAMADDL